MKLQQEIQEILKTSEINGGKYWSRKDGDIHAPHGYSTIDVLMTLGEIGHKYKDSKITTEAVVSGHIKTRHEWALFEAQNPPFS